VQHALEQAQQRLIKETKYKPFNEGDKVWLEGTHLKLPYDTMKLAPRWYGPFKVAAKISDVAYRLKLPNTWKIHNVFHTSLLTPYKETDKHGPNFLEPPPDLIDGEEEWEIEKILGHRTYRKKKQYLIRWKGYMLLRMDSWYISECFVVSGLPTVWIWDRANVGCHSWNPLTCLLSLCVPLMEG